ncbi:hypothetical protein ATN89_17600 [Comamonas thiooxydans]|uniref:hypothetical protein n=1 Tax=Comamonas thiooxydans TaxID=363952 RepID=UPI0007C4CBA2|nr:hypothetical protein [Comamonas thiooxydans]OAD82897.1 hypothetical protein ATN89_17600 [Comamonas thiooxydans]
MRSKTPATITDGIMFRRVKKGGAEILLTLEQSGRAFEVCVEAGSGIQQGDAQFPTIQKAIEFFDYATKQLAGREEPLDEFSIKDEHEIFLRIH